MSCVAKPRYLLSLKAGKDIVNRGNTETSARKLLGYTCLLNEAKEN